MSSPEAVSERTTFDLHDQFTIDGGDQSQFIAGATDPIHFGGGSLLINNSSEDVSATIRVYDSMDSVSWNLVPFTVSNLGSVFSFTLVPLSQKQILFDSALRYIRFVVLPFNPAGLQCVLQQHPPRARISVAGAY